jgi:hypothetical protein
MVPVFVLLSIMARLRNPNVSDVPSSVMKPIRGNLNTLLGNAVIAYPRWYRDQMWVYGI